MYVPDFYIYPPYILPRFSRVSWRTTHPPKPLHHPAVDRRYPSLTSHQDPTAALALVSAHRTSTSSTSATTTATSPAGKNEEDDVDLTRARELVELHYNVRERCRTGELKRGLEEARREVERVLGGGV